MATTKKVKKETKAKVIIKKVIAIAAYTIICVIVGFSIATGMYSAGFKFNLPKVTIEYSTDDHDLILIDRSVVSDSTSRVSGAGANAPE